MLKETQRFGDTPVSFFRLNGAVKTYSGGFFGQKRAFIFGPLKTKLLSKWSIALDCSFSCLKTKTKYFPERLRGI
jgi:hypothetical protein